MPRLVALLRGINVGGHRKVPMAQLREVAEGLGWEDVATYVQSGNLVAAAPRVSDAKAADQLSRAIEAAFGFTVPVVVRTASELAAIVEADPLGELADDPARHHVLFCDTAPKAAVLSRIDLDAFAPETFVARKRELYLWTPGGIGRSKLFLELTDKRLGVTVTARNWRTVEKLLEMASG